MMGGSLDVAFQRAARYCEGWIAGGGDPDQFAGGLEKLRAAWSEAGREGDPRAMALAYFSLGADGRRHADAYLKDYYAWLGDDVAAMIADSAAADEEGVQRTLSNLEQAGCDEVILFPCSSEPEQVELLASAAGLG